MNQAVNKKGYKHTPLGWLPEEWEVLKFSELCELKHGFQFREEHFIDKGIPVIKIGSLINGSGIRLDNLTYVKEELAAEYYQFQLNEGDILMALTGGTLGKVSVFPKLPGIYLQNYRVGNLIPKSNSIKSYILYLLQSHFIQKKIEDYVNEAAQPNFGKQDFDKLKIPLPPLSEQRKIAAILNAWDKAIDKTRHLISQLQKRNNGLMQQLLTGRKRLKGFQKEWKKLELGSLGDSYNGLSGKSKLDFGEGFSFITYLNIFSNPKIDTKDVGLVRVTKDESQNLVRKGDIFFTVSSETPEEVGMSSVLLEDMPNCYLNSFCFGFRLHDFSTLQPSFAAYLMRSEGMRKEIVKLAQGSTRFNLSKSGIMDLELHLPDINEQNAISKILDNAVAELQLYQQKLVYLQQQKKGIADRLLSGEIRVKI